MSGLYTRNNLSEAGLNATDALQKLYAPQVHQDLLLFAFASRLESVIYSPSTQSDNQIYGLINEPLANSAGVVSLRTKFITQGKLGSGADSLVQALYTFSDENRVWFDKFPVALDLRSGAELSVGAPIKSSVNGSIVAVSVLGSGEQYSVKDANGVAVTLPATVNARVVGRESGSKDAVVTVTVNSDGTISRTSSFEIVSGGSKYIAGEALELLPSCESYEDPAEDKCLNYSGNALYHDSYANGEVSTKALLKNERYTYRVKFADRDGFFLFDDKTSKYVYLGLAYDTAQVISPAPSPSLVLKRQDQISSDNLIQLYNLNGRSFFWSYEEGYESSNDISGNLRSLSGATEELRNGFKYFIQNKRVQKTEFDKMNNLGSKYNIIEGRNISTEHRMVFRDPDGVLDQSSVDFFALASLSQPGQVTLSGQAVPGIWLWTGEKYQRAFSSDDKAFMSQNGRNYLSPAIYNISGALLAESGAYKYSVSASYYKPGEPLTTASIRGFNTQISTLIQNISSMAGAGGFVFHRTLTVDNLTAPLKLWPLFSYMEGATIKDAKMLAI
jgi:hypothetical protein